MENRKVGYLIIGMAVVIGVIVLLFNNSLKGIVASTCVHGPACSMYGNIRTQTIISMVLVGAIGIIGIVLIFSREKEKIIVRTKKIKDEFAEKVKEEKENNLKLLNKEERIVYGILIKEKSMFQADLVDKASFSKVKITRILDKLENKSLIERKRRGMNNLVILR